jgi:D-apiose dehydrogenase
MDSDMDLLKNPLKAPRRIAVVGAGYFSQYHLDGWAQMAGVQVVALCDTDEIKAASLAHRYKIPKIYSHVAQMVAVTSPDLVDVVTPPASHLGVLQELFKHRMAVICQKPFGQNYAQALALTEAAKASGTPLIVHENFRFMPCYREARRWIDAGKLGDLHGISFRLRTGDGQGPHAYLDRQPYFQTMPRLLVAETAVHFIDTFRYLMGEVTAVYARLRQLNPAIMGEDAGLISFEFASGAAGVFDGNRLNDHPATNPRRTLGEMWLEGSKGVMRLDGDARLWWKPHQAKESEHIYNRGPDNTFGGGACGALQKHVLDALKNHQSIENTAHDYLRNLLIQEAVYASHASGQRIVLDTFSPPVIHP